ncbi:MAG: WGR domain-containing protein [Dolichospermum sp.]|nr:WGR domain-containing protein [Dolichospermum sp.]
MSGSKFVEIGTRSPTAPLLDPYYSPPASTQTVYLELSDDHSHKFYEVAINGLSVTIRYGRIDTSGQTDSKTYSSPQKAQAAAQKKINEKLKKGYVQLPTAESPSLASGSSLITQIAKESPVSNFTPYWLHEDFRVFTNDRGIVSTHSSGAEGFEARILPTVNQYTEADGGYVAFYSRDPAKAVYSVGGGIYVVGQIRLKGRYIGRIFHPAGYENQDISAAPEFKALCRQTFAVEGWAGGDTGGWFAGVNYRPEMMESTVSIKEAGLTTQGILVTVKAGEDVWWSIVNFRPGSTVEIVAISPNSWFSFNLMAGENFAYHFNPRSNEGQIVQNTKVGNWGLEERLPFPQEMAFGKKFTVKIAVQETQLAVYLNDTFLSHYRHRVQPAEIDSLRLICTQGNLQVLSVNISEPVVKTPRKP